MNEFVKWLLSLSLSDYIKWVMGYYRSHSVFGSDGRTTDGKDLRVYK